MMSKLPTKTSIIAKNHGVGSSMTHPLYSSHAREKRASRIHVSLGSTIGMKNARGNFFLNNLECSFYERSYHLDASAKTLYKARFLIYSQLLQKLTSDLILNEQDNLKVQIKALMGMMNLILSMYKDRSKTDKTLAAVANGHSKKGVKAHQYGIVGEVVIWTFQNCIGSEFCSNCVTAWSKVFSHCLKIILPIAIANDRKENVAVIPTREEAASQREQQSRRLGGGEEPSTRSSLVLGYSRSGSLPTVSEVNSEIKSNPASTAVDNKLVVGSATEVATSADAGEGLSTSTGEIAANTSAITNNS